MVTFCFCVDYGQQNQVDIYNGLLTNTTKLTKGDQTMVYVMVQVENKTANGSFIYPPTQKAVFFPKMDTFAQLLIPGTGLLFKDTEYVSVFINIGGRISEKRYYKKLDYAGMFAAYFTAVITLVGGIPTVVQWDDSCSGCDPKTNCIDAQNCAIKYVGESPAVDCTDTTLCNLMVYLVWIGDDANNAPLKSSAYMPSRFAAYALNPIYQSAANVAKERYV